MAEVILSERLKTLAGMVTPGMRVADVGCDHGLVSIYLVQKRISPKVLAMDVRTGPLSGAQKHISEYGLDNYIETRLSDGLCALTEGEADALICAGMGGRLMARILSEGSSKAKQLKELILQPQSELEEFRRFLRTEGYMLLDENIVYEEGKYYFFLKVCSGQKKPCEQKEKVTDTINERLGDKFGSILLQRRERLLGQYLVGQLDKLDRIRASLAENEKVRARDRYEQLQEEIEDIKRALLLFK